MTFNNFFIKFTTCLFSSFVSVHKRWMHNLSFVSYKKASDLEWGTKLWINVKWYFNFGCLLHHKQINKLIGY